MAVAYSGHGVSYTRGAYAGKAHKIVFGGDSKEEIDVTTLSNTAAKTFIMGALYTSGDITINSEYDPSTVLGLISTGNTSTVITFADASTITLWTDVMEVGDVEFNNDTKPTFDIVLKVTNLNSAGAETVPVLG